MTDVVVNCWAILVCAIMNMALGFAWFGPLFGKQWVAIMGWTPEQMQAGQEKMKKSGWKTYLLAFIGAWVTAWVLAYSLIFASAYLGIYGVNAGLQGGFWMWLGFVAPVTLSAVLWEGKPWKWWTLMNGYYLVSLLIMGLILSLWI